MPSSADHSDFETMLETDGEIFFPCHGFSMYPLIHPMEDIVHIIKPSREYKVQDVVLYKDREHHYVLHRIQRIRKDTVILFGDHNVFLDAPIEKNQILGLLSDIRKKDGRIIDMDTQRRFHGWFLVHFFHIHVFFLWCCHLLWKGKER